MKMVIDIPDAIYERFGYEYSELSLISKDVDEAIMYAFCDGTPLPKGHGRLIDVSQLPLDIEWNDIEKAPTIIEGDRREEKDLNNDKLTADELFEKYDFKKVLDNGGKYDPIEYRYEDGSFVQTIKFN